MRSLGGLAEDVDAGLKDQLNLAQNPRQYIEICLVGKQGRKSAVETHAGRFTERKGSESEHSREQGHERLDRLEGVWTDIQGEAGEEHEIIPERLGVVVEIRGKEHFAQKAMRLKIDEHQRREPRFLLETELEVGLLKKRGDLVECGGRIHGV